MEALRDAGELRDGDARAATAERAVAPLAMEEDVEEVAPETEGGDRREAGVGRAGAAVAIMGYRYRSGIFVSSRASRTAQPSTVADVGERVSWREAGDGGWSLSL